MRVFLNACYRTPFFNAGQNTCLKKVCQRNFSFDVSVIQMHTVLPAVLKQWWKTKGKKEKTKEKRKTMMIKEYTYKKRKRGEDYAIQALILFVPKTEIS